MITDWPKGKDFEVSPEKEKMLFKEAALYHELHGAAPVETGFKSISLEWGD